MKFSVITPTKNRPEWVVRAVESVLAQTHADWEHIVLDLSDESVERLLPADPRIRYVRGGTAQGPARDFQRALELATGEIVHPLSDDDRIAPHALAYVAEHIGDHEWLYCRTEIAHADGRFVQYAGWPHDLETLRRGFNLGGAVYWRRALTDRIGGFDPAYDHAADFDLYLRFALTSTPLFAEEVLYHYTEHERTDTNVNAEPQRLAVERVKERYAVVQFGSPEVDLPPLRLEVRRLAVAVHADELLATPALLEAWGRTFDARDDATLVIYAPGEREEVLLPQVVELCGSVGVDLEEGPDLVLVPADRRQEGAFVRQLSAVLSQREPRGYFVTVPHVAPEAIGSLRGPAAGPPPQAPPRDRRSIRPRASDMRLLTCMVVHNRLELTRATLESYLETIRVPHYLVVVDNASTDGTAELLEGHAGIDHLILSPRNLYPGAAANLGWQAGLARFDPTHLHRSDNDMLYRPGWDLHALQCMLAMPRLGQLGLCNQDGGNHLAGFGDGSGGRERAAGDRCTLHTEHGVSVNVWWTNVGGTHVTRKTLWTQGLRYVEAPWHADGGPTAQEDVRFSLEVKRLGWFFANVLPPTCVHIGVEYEKYPEYYQRTFAERGYATPV